MNQLVPVDLEGVRVFVEARPIAPARGEEQPVGVPLPASLERALSGAAKAIKQTVGSLEELSWAKLTVELGVEFVAETSGSLAAVIGKLEGHSSLKVTLEFDRTEK